MNKLTKKILKETSRYLILGGLLLLTACGGGSDSDSGPEPVVNEGLAKFEEQEIAWAACDPNLFSEDDAEGLAILGDRLECATLKTPLDWDDPARDEVNLGVLRVRAGDPDNRQGAIFTNPGGPGGDGLTLGALFGLIFASGGIEGLPVAAPDLLMQVSERYDIIGFSPRGLGGSFQLFCGSNKLFPATNFYTDRSPENAQALLESSRLQAEACLNNPLYKYISTEQTVQDMDLIRRLLGDEKLNFLGYSYGTWLGAWYAKRFPTHAGNMVLDANLDFTAGFQEAIFELVRGSERAFEDVALAYAARNDALYGLGSSAEEILGLYNDFPRELKAALVAGSASISGDLYDSEAVGDIAIDLVAAKGISAALTSFEEPVTPDNFAAFAAQLATVSYAENEEVNRAAQDAALVIAEDYVAATLDQPEEVVLGPDDAVFEAVTCNDTAFNRNPDFWIQTGDDFNTLYPLLGGSVTANAACAFWTEPTTTMPDVPDNIPPVLMIQTGFDPATPVEGARRAFESLPNAKFVYIENEMSHTAFPYNTGCVDEKVAAYLLDGTLPEEDTSSCDAKPLPGEEEVFPPGSVPTFGGERLGVQAAETFGENPLYDLVHKRIRENAADFYTP